LKHGGYPPDDFSTDLFLSGSASGMLPHGLPRRRTSGPGVRRRRMGAPGGCPDILAHRSSQPNHVIRRLNNTGAALKRCAVQD
jgi:hypothetical protein